jgi:hypothetical protein
MSSDISNGIGESSNEDSSSASHKTSLETPRVLTRNLIPSLTHGLDASDMLECYTLVRSAPLHGIANSTITIQKQALGIRFRPKQDVAALNVKRPMELTLEFGPQRVGQDLNDVAMPIVQMDETSSYLSWDNTGKVYFTRAIVKKNYLSSYYMASITGAVLDKLLTEAVEYAERRKIYQPFAVYSEANGRELRSSSSSDFTWFTWTRLARLGVEIEPILPPPVYEARLWANSVTKVVPEPSVAAKAASFYQKLYSCLGAIATNDYGNFEDASSVAPTTSSSPTTSPGSGDLRRRIEDKQEQGDAKNTENSTNGQKEEQGKLQSGEEDVGNDSSSTATPTTFDATEPPTIHSPHPSASPTTDPGSSSPTEYESEELTITEGDKSPEDDSSPAEPAKDAEKAKQAADDAQKAADEAKNAAQTEGETKAADAAQAAADAAHAAADATSKAASKQAMDSLLSGDGSMMSAIATTCFTDPRYGIGSVDVNGTITAEAYLYRDSAFYYKLELVSPFIGVAKINRALPMAIYPSDFGGGGDPLDWFLALSLAATLLFLVLLICQQTGKNYITTLARCQRWFFNPRKYDYEGEKVSGMQSGPLFFFGESGIPPSMGGRRSTYSPIRPGESLDAVLADSVVCADDDEDVDDLGLPEIHYQGSNEEEQLQIEMQSLSPRFDIHSPPRPGNAVRTPVQRSASSNGRRGRSNSNMRHNSSSNSLESADEDPDVALENSLPVPQRFFRDPNEVEMPSLKSKSKIAVPVGSNNSIASNRSRSSSLGDAGLSDPFEL